MDDEVVWKGREAMSLNIRTFRRRPTEATVPLRHLVASITLASASESSLAAAARAIGNTSFRLYPLRGWRASGPVAALGDEGMDLLGCRQEAEGGQPL